MRIDADGRPVIKPQFAQGGDGLAAVEAFNAGPGTHDYAKPQTFGYVDANGVLTIPATFLYAGAFTEGLAAVGTKRGWRGFIDRGGALVVPPVRCELAGPFTGGLALIQGANGSAGYVDRAGHVVWPPQE